MESKPTQAIGYSTAALQWVHSATLYIANLRDDFVIVGGLVPSLIIPQEPSHPDRPLHVGTMDVDLGLAIAILDHERYRELCQRLWNAGFRPHSNENGKSTSQRWIIQSERHLTVDFLIPATLKTDRGGTLRHLQEGFAAIITPGLELAFEDKRLVTLAGTTLLGEQASREVWVCEAGAFVVLKALAFDGRGENKDAYDLTYLLQHYGHGIDDVFQRLAPLLNSQPAKRALEILARDFATVNSVGSKRVSQFLGDSEDETVRADATGVVRSLLGLCRRRA